MTLLNSIRAADKGSPCLLLMQSTLSGRMKVLTRLNSLCDAHRPYVVARPDVYERYRRVIRGTALLLVAGVAERKEGVSNLVAVRFGALG